jgi:dihydrofolate reductase
MLLSLILAMSREGVIGRQGKLPWHLPRDLKRFRQLTWGKPIIMGRKTLESIGRPLPGRCNIVLTHQPDYRAEGVLLAHSAEEAISLASRELNRTGGEEAFVIGGEQVFARFQDLCRRAYVTVVEGALAGETVFPCRPPGPPEWQLVHEEACPADEKNPYPHRFSIYKRDSQGTSPGSSGADE